MIQISHQSLIEIVMRNRIDKDEMNFPFFWVKMP